MKTTTTECFEMLQSGADVFMVEVFTLTLVGGTIVRWASSDIEINFAGRTWLPGPIIERDAITTTIGIEVTDCGVTLHADDSVTILSMPLLHAARRGVLDGASLLIERAFTDSPGNPIKGCVHLFEGRVGDLEINGTSLKLTVKLFTELLDTQVPVDVYQETCLHTLYSPHSDDKPGCGLNKAANGITLTVGAGSTRSNLVCGVTGSGSYDLGELIFSSGVNSGIRRSVKTHTTGNLLLSFPLEDAPAVGDSFTVYKGCNKTKETCSAKFSNVVHFRGFPYVPQPETAV